jgi:pterin-4a-carbinolamine dehydratase
VSTSNRPEAHAWRSRERPLRLERRLEFPDYESTRLFLEGSEALSEETGIYPNLSFGRTYVNLTLFADEARGEITPELKRFAGQIDALAGRQPEDPE